MTRSRRSMGWWLALAAALPLLGGGWWLRDAAEGRLAAARASLERVEGARHRARRARHLVERYTPRYRALVARGVIVEPGAGEPPAPMADGGRGVRYREQPAEPFAPLPGGLAQRVVVETPLRHEGELLTRLALIRGAGGGWLRVDGCELRRDAGAEGGGLRARCDLRRLFTAPGRGGP